MAGVSQSTGWRRTARAPSKSSSRSCTPAGNSTRRCPGFRWTPRCRGLGRQRPLQLALGPRVPRRHTLVLHGREIPARRVFPVSPISLLPMLWRGSSRCDRSGSRAAGRGSGPCHLRCGLPSADSVAIRTFPGSHREAHVRGFVRFCRNGNTGAVSK